MENLNLGIKFMSLIVIIALTLIDNSCTHPTENIDKIPTVCFETEVLPIFQTNCAMSGCHSGNNPEEGYLCTDYQSIMKNIKPNSLSGSKAYQVITDSWFETMPPSPYKMLSEEQRTFIAVWIQQGAKETKCN